MGSTRAPDPYQRLYDLAASLHQEPLVISARLESGGASDLLLVVELAIFDADTWDRITEQVHDLVRDPIHATSVHLDIRIREP